MKIIHTKLKITAGAISFLWWKRIYTGVYFNGLHGAERMAVLAHEKAHCNRHHTEIRLALLLLFPFSLLLFRRVFHFQELQADRDAARDGHAYGLMKFILRVHNEGPYHPINELRIMNIEKYAFRPGLVKTYSQSA